jgi:hypothetical protein
MANAGIEAIAHLTMNTTIEPKGIFDVYDGNAVVPNRRSTDPGIAGS